MLQNVHGTVGPSAASSFSFSSSSLSAAIVSTQPSHTFSSCSPNLWFLLHSSQTGFVGANPADMRVGMEVLKLEAGADSDLVHPSRPLLSRFKLQTTNQYAAAKQLNKWDAHHGEAMGTTAEQNNQREELLEAEKAEALMNENEYNLAVGHKAIYGGQYQLLSTACDQFVS